MAKRKRITNMPTKRLEAVLPMLKNIYRGFHTESCNRENIASVIGENQQSGRYLTRLAALVHFGLLKRHKSNYWISKLALKYLTPVQENDDKLALREGVLQPPFYRELYERYQKQSLPQALGNIIARTKEIPLEKAEKIADAIRDNFEFVGLLKNGIVQNIGQQAIPTTKGGGMPDAIEKQPLDETYDDTAAVEATANASAQKESHTAGASRRSTFPLDNGEVVMMEWPASITKDDCDDIIAWLEILKRKLQRSISENEDSYD